MGSKPKASKALAKFTKTPTLIARDHRISIAARHLLTVLCGYCYGKRDTCFPSIEKLSEHMGISPRSVFRFLNELEDLKLIARTKKHPGQHKSPNLYILTFFEEEERLQSLQKHTRRLKRAVTPVSVI